VKLGLKVVCVKPNN